MRTLAKEKIRRPPFEYEKFGTWLLEPHEQFVIEIGCGVGRHPIQWAQQNPRSKILAIERTKEKFGKFANRLKHHSHLKNIFPAHADAAVLLPHLLTSFDSSPSRQVDAYFILYPNPYPKNRHKNRRFAYSPLTHFMAQTLKPNGLLTIATNISSYAVELSHELPSQCGLSLVEEKIVDGSSPPFRSHFEKKYLQRGDTCHNLVFRRG